MNTIEIGKRLVELASDSADAQALDELYADSIMSIEANAEGEPQTWEGIKAVREKHAWWESVTTMHSTTVEGPFAGSGDDQFVVRFDMDVTMQDQGRSQMSEVGLYTVANGKIVREVYLPLVAN
ncbi:MAG: nuclear transport factor 2 family protein [Pseudomonadaceae bacterium]|nr:nuclear transport factor 2 family protein [Pseudomonadaceae bacterium]